MKLDLVIFDFDGVLCDCKDIHYEALNEAIEEIAGSQYKISRDEHLTIFDGLKTDDKLNLLTLNKGLDKHLHDRIWLEKQRRTKDKMSLLPIDNSKIEILKKLKVDNINVACCSNSIADTLFTALNRLGILQLFDYVISNEDVCYPKPHPECYWKAMTEFGVAPENTLIIEDSPNGLLAAARSGAKVLRVDNAHSYSYNDIMSQENNLKPKWVDKKLNIVVPMAGEGSRFVSAGYTFPKPIIDVLGKPMIKWVVDSLNIEANFIFLVRKWQLEKFNLKPMLELIAPGCKIVEVDGLTEGAAKTVLLAKDYINNDGPLLIANSDQYIEWDSLKFFYKVGETKVDGAILTFENFHPKWSYVEVVNGYVSRVAEKEVISNEASVGIYYYNKGSDFVKFANQMIDKNIRTNNEFYVCPAYNEMIDSGGKVITYRVDRMHGLGTPEDLTSFINGRTV